MADWPGQTPERKQRIAQALRDGRFVVHGLPFTTHTELLEPEDLVRGLEFLDPGFADGGTGAAARREDDGRALPLVILPTLLCHAGIEFLHLGCNAASSSPQVPPLFWWKARTAPGAHHVCGRRLRQRAGAACRLALPDMAGAHSHRRQSGPAAAGEVTQLLAEAQAQWPTVKVRIGRLSTSPTRCWPKASVRRCAATCPTRGSTVPCATRRVCAWARRIRPQLAAANRSTRSAALGRPASRTRRSAWPPLTKRVCCTANTPGRRAVLGLAYDQPLTMTYGDTWKEQRAAGKFERLEASWAEHTAVHRNSSRRRPAVAGPQLQRLAQSVSGPSDRVVVFNPLRGRATDFLSVPWQGAPPAGLRPARRDCLPVCVSEHLLHFIARDVPAFGYRTYVPDAAVDTDDAPQR